jgi:hypothetical protein
MTIEDYHKLPYAQRAALAEVYHRKELAITWKEFLDTAAVHHHMSDCVMVPWSGMVLGIETDGHTHS